MSDYTLHCGDALEWLATLDAGSVDAIITDLPYGTTACSWDVVIPFEPMWSEVKRVLKPNGAFVTTASQPFTSTLVMSNPDWFKYEWIWDKTRVTGGVNSDNAPMKAHENIVVFSQSRHIYNPQMSRWTVDEIKRKRDHDFLLKPNEKFIYSSCIAPGRQKQIESGRHPDSVIRIRALGSISPERTDHPTQKPVALYEYLILTYTNPGDLVVDFVMGSGTTGVACMRTGRRFAGCDKDAHYFEIAKRRIEQAAAQLILPLESAYQ